MNIIDRVEFQVGTQIWQTLEKDDIRVLYTTELSEGAYGVSANSARPASAGKKVLDVSGTASDIDAFNCTFVLPCLTKTVGPQMETFTNVTESGYPMAAAPHQSVKVKFYFMERPAELKLKTAIAASAAAGTLIEVVKDPLISRIQHAAAASGITSAANDTVQTTGLHPVRITGIKLYAKHAIMCNEERESMKMMPMGLPRRLKMTQNATFTDLTAVKTKTFDLDHFSLLTSHLIITGFLGVGKFIKSVELKLNSSSFSGVLPANLLDYSSTSTLGLYTNRNLYAGQEELSGVGTLVFPLASTAYSGSSVPLNRFDSIRLTLVFTDSPVREDDPRINITCVGETTALFKGGAASLAMY